MQELKSLGEMASDSFSLYNPDKTTKYSIDYILGIEFMNLLLQLNIPFMSKLALLHKIPK